MQTVKFTDIVAKYRDALKNNTPINEFCLNKYGVKPTLFIGLNGKSLPDDQFCPAIVLLPGVKHEGLEVSGNEYIAGVMWSIKNGKVLVDGVERDWSPKLSGNVVEFVGVSETDALGQLIYEALAEVSDNYPVSKIEFNLESQQAYPQWPGYMFITHEADVIIGGNLEF
jgi:hypothetical protein